MWEINYTKVGIRLKFLTVRVKQKEYLAGHYEPFFIAKHFVRGKISTKNWKQLK